MGQRLDNAKNLYIEAIQDGHAAAAINKYAGERYTQHSTPVRDGRDGFIDFFEDFHRRNPVREIEIIRGFEDGPFVFLHVIQILNHGEFRYVTADIFETNSEAQLIEHWDLIEELRGTTDSKGAETGNQQIDGPTEPTDLDRTEENKAVVTSFLREVMKDGHHDRLSDFVLLNNYVEHSPRGPLSELSMAYERVYRVIGSGDFVATLSQTRSGENGTAVIDLFRLEGGVIVEHWDVAEQIHPRESWVNSGKF